MRRKCCGGNDSMSGLENGGNGSGKSSAPRPRGKRREKSGIGFEVFIF
jgi:hypothetical protein